MQLNSINISILCGKGDFDNMPSLKKLVPFDDTICDFFAELSAEILKRPESRQFPDVVTFGFFCRKGSIGRLKSDYEGKISHRLGRGVSFHIAPSNVPINFAYSLSAALLAGNACIVRASSKPFRQTDLVCECIETVLKNERFSSLAEYISVVRYAHNKEVTDFFSSLCDIRVIWGGDATISEIRKSELPPRAVEIAFADRYSIAVMSPEAVLEADDLSKTAHDFYNDTYLYDQNACSSPRLIYWLGDREKAAAASDRFFESVHSFIKDKYKLEPVIAVDKYCTACRAAIGCNAKIVPAADNLVSRIWVSELDENIAGYQCAGGSFIEFASESLDPLADIVTRKFQTLAYFGTDKSELADFVISRGLSGIDRIVPIGKTADFALVWDGYDLIMQMSRVIS